MNTWLELHVDDVLLSLDPGAWPEVAALLDGAARAAESEGGRLSFRIRSAFAEGDRTGFLRGLMARGHEVGAHAHVKDLEATVAALRAAGIAPTVFAPGLVQAGVAGEAALVARAVALGALGITDRLDVRRWTYQGWLPRRHPAGPWMLDVSVSPWAWGVLRDGPEGPEPAHALDWAALDRCARVQARWRAPAERTPFFGATFHEHDLCPPRALAASDPSFDGLRRWVAAWKPGPSTSSAVGPEVEAEAPTRAHAAPDGPPASTPASPPRRHRPWPRRAPDPSDRHPLLHAALRRTSAAALTWAGAHFGAHELPPHQVIRGATPRATVVCVHAGDGGLAERLRFLGLGDEGFGPEIDLWLYARRPAGWAAPGNPAHVDDARRVLRAAARSGLPLIVLTWSGGCVPGARAILELAEAEPPLAAHVAALVDVEGPPDRLALVKPGAEAEWAAFSPHDDTPWVGRELVTLLPELARLPSPPEYHRWQGRPDHVHGDCTLHADVAMAAARAAGLRAELVRVAGELARHGGRWSASLAEIVDRVAREARR